MKVFFPFPFQTVQDRIRTFAVLNDLRASNSPVPEGLGRLLLSSTEPELRVYVNEIREFCGEGGHRVAPAFRQIAVNALDVLGYFHGLSCQDGSGLCLGKDIEDLVIDFTE